MSLRVDRLRETREKRGLTQRQLSIRCSIGENQINKFENGGGEPSLATITAIARELNLSVDYLLGLSDNELGQLGDTHLNQNEQDIVNVLRREGWLGLIRFCTERMAKSG
jgi:transcriptional regulator with XRE-family HTH domain